MAKRPNGPKQTPVWWRCWSCDQVYDLVEHDNKCPFCKAPKDTRK